MNTTIPSRAMTQNTSPFFSGTLRERVLVALASPVLAFACGWCLLMTESVLSDNRAATPRGRFVLDVFHFLCIELFVAAFVFLLLAFIWAILRPRWIIRLMTAMSHHVWRAVCLVLLALLLTAFIGSAIAHVF